MPLKLRMEENLHLHLIKIWQNVLFSDHLTPYNDNVCIKSRLAQCIFYF